MRRERSLGSAGQAHSPGLRDDGGGWIREVGGKYMGEGAAAS